MRTLKFMILVIAVASLNLSCSAQQENNDKSASLVKSDEIEVFYFHYTRRCVTCQAIEDVAKNAIAEVYGDQVTFIELNLDEQDGKQKAEEIGVSGQTLLITSGDIQMDITNEGFMYARSNPERLKQVITEKINPLLQL